MPYDLSPKYQPYVPTSEQDVFDFAARHLLTQGAPSATEVDGCAYRGPEGLMCAVGIFLADDEVVEGAPAASLVLGTTVRDDCPGIPRLAPYVGLLDRLQDVHDENPPTSWRRQLSCIAEEYGLSATVLEEV